MPPIMRKKRLNIPQERTVPTNLASDLVRLPVHIQNPPYRMSLT
jgi:hypothetical protein